MRNKLIFFLFILFVIFIPISLKFIGLVQNDEWVYYPTIKNFLSFNFYLHPFVGTTFYSQAFLSLPFAYIFGLQYLPLLSLIVSILNIFIFIKLVQFIVPKGTFLFYVLVSLILFFNPIFFYSSFGFMTEVYTLLFILLSFYIYIYFLNNPSKNILFYLSLFFAVLAFFNRQTSVVLFPAFFIHLLFKKEYKKSIFVILITFFLLIFYIFIFPKTPIMQKPYILQTNFYLFYKRFLGVLIYFGAFSLGVAPFILKKIFKFKKKELIIFFVLFTLSSFLLFKITSLWIFPYFFNIFERFGFLYGELPGLKYSFRGFYTIFIWWERFSILFLSFLISLSFIHILKLPISYKNIFTFFKNIYFLFFLLNFFSILLLPKFYDRYFIYTFVFFLLFILHSFKNYFKEPSLLTNTFLGLFVLFLGIYSLQNELDYLWWQKLTYSESFKLVNKGILPNQIYSTNAWRKKYNIPEENLKNPNLKYFFSFKMPKNSVPNNFKIYNIYTNKKALNLFLNPKIYLYEKAEKH